MFIAPTQSRAKVSTRGMVLTLNFDTTVQAGVGTLGIYYLHNDQSFANSAGVSQAVYFGSPRRRNFYHDPLSTT